MSKNRNIEKFKISKAQNKEKNIVSLREKILDLRCKIQFCIVPDQSGRQRSITQNRSMIARRTRRRRSSGLIFYFFARIPQLRSVSPHFIRDFSFEILQCRFPHVLHIFGALFDATHRGFDSGIGFFLHSFDKGST